MRRHQLQHEGRSQSLGRWNAAASSIAGAAGPDRLMETWGDWTTDSALLQLFHLPNFVQRNIRSFPRAQAEPVNEGKG